MDDFVRDCMQTMGLPGQYYPMVTMPQQQLESMYPKTYQIIQPAIEGTCDMVTQHYGQQYSPTKDQLESMIDNVYANVEADVEAAVKQSPMEGERQFYGGGRRLLRDFIGVLLISNLLRRRRPYYGYPGYYGYPDFYGYPGYYGGGYGYSGSYPIY